MRGLEKRVAALEALSGTGGEAVLIWGSPGGELIGYAIGERFSGERKIIERKAGETIEALQKRAIAVDAAHRRKNDPVRFLMEVRT